MNTYTKTLGGPLWGAQKSTNRGETSTNRMSFRRISESSFSRSNESITAFFRHKRVAGATGAPSRRPAAARYKSERVR